MKLIAAALLALLVGCGADAPDTRQDQQLDEVHERAPSWTHAYGDPEILRMLQKVCEGDDLLGEAASGSVTTEDHGFLVGLALSSECNR